jgi:PTH1 family peptidyl-tRNA hydrolase
VRFVVVGLGNPGEDYANTRHNVGFMVVDELAGRCGAGVARRVGGAEVRRSDTVPSGPVAFAKPLSFMNRSGGPSLAVLRAAGCSDSQCIVVVDDVNLPLGRIRVRRGGSDGGHNGLKSMIAAVGEGFPRVRVGVGPVAAGESLVDFVLGQFAAHEVETVHDAVGRAADAVLCAIADGVEAAMSRYNR